MLKGEFCDGHDTVIGVLGCQDVFSRNGLGIRDFLLENASILTSERRSFFNWSCHNSIPYTLNINNAEGNVNRAVLPCICVRDSDPLGRRLAERPKGTQQGSVLTALRAIRPTRSPTRSAISKTEEELGLQKFLCPIGYIFG